VAARLTRNEADAEDLVADTIARAWGARESLMAPSAFPAWIFRILNNTFISDRRRASVRGQTEPIEDAEPDNSQPFSIFRAAASAFLVVVLQSRAGVPRQTAA
jgi:RNA polymerase sigma-70 factor (ECF subfamily)